jgi:hypothetical protein
MVDYLSTFFLWKDRRLLQKHPRHPGNTTSSKTKPGLAFFLDAVS